MQKKSRRYTITAARTKKENINEKSVSIYCMYCFNIKITDMYCFDIKNNKKTDYLPYTDVLTPGVTRNMVFSNKLSQWHKSVESQNR